MADMLRNITGGGYFESPSVKAFEDMDKSVIANEVKQTCDIEHKILSPKTTFLSQNDINKDISHAEKSERIYSASYDIEITSPKIGEEPMLVSKANDTLAVRSDVLTSPQPSPDIRRGRKCAFTLAEVLITLGIIGIVAALTIPAIMQSTNHKELVSAFLKTTNVMSNNFKQANAITGTKVEHIETFDDFKTWFEEHLKVVSRKETGCAFDVCLADGSGFTYGENFTSGCNYDASAGSSTNALKESCISLMVDVNGQKNPNKAGKDQYTLRVTKYGVYPQGDSTVCEGFDCGMYTLRTHKIWNGEVLEASIPQNTQQQTQQPIPQQQNETPQSQEESQQAETPNAPSSCSSFTETGCTTANGITMTKLSTTSGDYYVSQYLGDVTGLDSAQSSCPSGTHIPTESEMMDIYNAGFKPDVFASPSGGSYYWTSSTVGSKGMIRTFRFGNSTGYSLGTANPSGAKMMTLCLGQ